MIVHPDFLDHWKTQRLITLTGDPSAPQLVLRLWAYCQMQRESTFEAVPNLSAICRSPLPTDTILAHFLECGFVKKGAQNELIIHDWEEHNRVLRNSWINGQKGGKKPTGSTYPTGYPRATHRQPIGNPSRARAEEKNKTKNKVGYPRVSAQTPNHGGVTHSVPSVEGSEEAEKAPEILTQEQIEKNHKSFAAHLRDLSAKMKSGQPILQTPPDQPPDPNS